MSRSRGRDRRRQVVTRFLPEELAEIDRVRGGEPREGWMRGVCADAVAAYDGLRAPDLVEGDGSGVAMVLMPTCPEHPDDGSLVLPGRVVCGASGCPRVLRTVQVMNLPAVLECARQSRRDGFGVTGVMLHELAGGDTGLYQHAMVEAGLLVPSGQVGDDSLDPCPLCGWSLSAEGASFADPS